MAFAFTIGSLVRTKDGRFGVVDSYSVKVDSFPVFSRMNGTILKLYVSDSYGSATVNFGTSLEVLPISDVSLAVRE